jgi:DNA-binding response OmpR family regulator
LRKIQRVRALRLGVDDWVAKPYHPEEVIARIEAVTRRHRRARVEAQGRVLERETIYQRVWGYAMAHGDRSVDVFVRQWCSDCPERGQRGACVSQAVHDAFTAA